MPICRRTCLYYIGGILKHAKAINAFTNASTNSYKRLVPGLRSPGSAGLLGPQPVGIHAVFRSPPRRRPSAWKSASRTRPPTRISAFAAMLMAGLDGIKNKIHPGDPMDKNLYDLPADELKDIPTVCGSLREACDALDADREFLKAGGVMDDDQIDAYLELKREENEAYEMTPHPIEFDLYYSV